MTITEKNSTSDCSDTIRVISQIQKCSKKRKRFTFMNITVFMYSPLRPEPGYAVKLEFLFFFHISVITHLIIRVLSLSLTFFESISYIIWHLVVNWYYTNVFFQPLLLGAYISSHTNPLHVLSPYVNEFSLWSSFFLPASIPLAAPSSISFA